MKSLVRVAGREIIEKRNFFLLAALASIFPVLAPLYPGLERSAAGDLRGSVAVVLVSAFALGLSAMFGITLVAGPLAERRMGFFFSRPVGATSIWAGKFLGGWLFVVLFSAIVAGPAFVAGGHFGAVLGLDRAALPYGLAFFAVASLVLMAFFHVVSIAARSASGWAAVDLIGAMAVCGGFWLALRRLGDLRAGEALMIVMWTIATSTIVGLLAAGGAQVVGGRADLRRGHRIQSLVLWSILVPASAGSLYYQHWYETPGTKDLTSLWATEVSPRGNWLTIAGSASHRPDLQPRFLFEPSTGRAIRLMVGHTSLGDPVFSLDGRRAAWFEFTGRIYRSPVAVTTLDLDRPGSEPRATTIIVSEPWKIAMVLSDDGSRLAILNGGALWLYELPSGRLVSAATVSQADRAEGFGKVQFVGQDRVRVFSYSEGAQRGEAGSATISEFDALAKRLVVVGKIDRITSSGWNSLRVDSTGRRLLVNDRNDESVVLRDAGTGELIARLEAATGGKVTTRRARFLSDGRIALCEAGPDGAKLMLLSSEAALLRTIDLPQGEVVVIGGEPSPGRLWVDIHPKWAPGFPDHAEEKWNLVLVDLATADVRPMARGYRPARGTWFPGIGLGRSIEPGSEAVNVYARLGTEIVRIDPATGGEKVLIGVSGGKPRT